jgi:hypothetical protein
MNIFSDCPKIYLNYFSFLLKYLNINETLSFIISFAEYACSVFTLCFCSVVSYYFGLCMERLRRTIKILGLGKRFPYVMAPDPVEDDIT